MSSMIKEEDLLEELQSLGLCIKDENVILKIMELCIIYKIAAEKFASILVAFNLSRNIGETTTESLILLENEELSKKFSKAPMSSDTHKTPVRKSAKRSAYNSVLGEYGNFETPKGPRNSSAQRKVQSPFSPNSISPRLNTTPSSGYRDRKQSGAVQSSLNVVKEDDWSRAKAEDKLVTLECVNPRWNKPPKYMFEKLRDRADHLLDHIVDLSQLILEPLEDATDETYLGGQIFGTAPGKLSPDSLAMATENGDKILDVSALSEFTFFPGQVVVGKGLIQGKIFHLTQIIKSPLLPFPTEPPQLEESDPLHIVAACGPFTTSETFYYEALHDLMTYVEQHRPHVCILMGPFLDIKHQAIEKNELEETFAAVFDQFLESIYSFADRAPGTQIVLIPSLRDVHHDGIYPTPPFPHTSSCKNVHFVPNPCYLDVQGVRIAATSTDILFHLGKEEINNPPGSSDRLGRLCGHLLAQQSLYPLYPPGEGVLLDLELTQTYAQMTHRPHILLLPSDLRGFVKDIAGCCCINPERLTRGQVGGSFARIRVTLPSDFSGSLTPGIQAQVVKI